MLIFPVSPLPASLTRQFNWNDVSIRYESGEQQGASTYSRPLYLYNVPIKLMTEFKQGSLSAFVNNVRGTTIPFLMKDPYDYQVNSNIAANSGVTNAATFYLRTVNSYTVRADTTTIGSLFSSLSGYVRLGVEYGYEQDTGIFTVNTKAQADVWGMRSVTYFRKVKFTAPYVEQSQLWNIFSVQGLTIEELP